MNILDEMYLSAHHSREDFDKVMVGFRPWLITCLDMPSKEIQLLAVKKNGNVIKYIENPDNDVQLAAVTNNPYVIEFMDNPCRKIQLAAVRLDPKVIMYIVDPTSEVQLEAVKIDPRLYYSNSNYVRGDWSQEVKLYMKIEKMTV